MKSNICTLNGEAGQLAALLNEVEKCAAYNNMNKKNTLRVRLLAEELVGMLPALLEHSEGSFWMENEQNKYELHVKVRARETGYTTREKLLAVSKTGKNMAQKGIMGKIRAAAEMMLFSSEDDVIETDFFDAGCEASPSFGQVWSLRHYSDQISIEKDSAKTEEWDELEKSIIAKLADDVMVGIKGKNVEIIVCKEFA